MKVDELELGLTVEGRDARPASKKGAARGSDPPRKPLKPLIYKAFSRFWPSI